MPARKLADDEINKLLSRMPGWRLVAGKLHKQFECKDFNAAFGNMTRVALVAEAMNHHPEWSNVWNKVVIDLNTHSVKGISDFDFVLAEKIQPKLDFSYGTLGGGAADSWNSFLSAAGGPAPQRFVARSSDTFYCRAADLSGGPDRRHRQVAHSREFCGRAT